MGRRLFPRPVSSIFTGCKASGMAAFFHNSALSCKGQRQAQALALCASLGLLPPFSATGGGGIRPRRARKRQKCMLVWCQALACSSGNNVFSTHQVTSAIVGPGTNRRFLPVAEIESAVRSSETSNLPCGELRRLSLRILTALVGDEPPMTACGGNFIGGEISRNKQSPL